jgi:hypothetical protein
MNKARCIVLVHYPVFGVDDPADGEVEEGVVVADPANL